MAERFLIPVQCSAHPTPWIAAHTALALPLRLAGPLYRARAWVEDAPVSVLGMGSARRLRLLLQRLFEGRVDDLQRIGWRFHWRPLRPSREAADLIAAEVHPWTASLYRRAGWLVVPDAVRWRGDPAVIPPARPSKGLASDLRHLRRHGYGLEVGATTEDWEEFYTRMVIPHARNRFGSDAWVPSRGLFRAFAARGTLLFVTAGRERIAGVCAVPARGMIWMPVLGVRDGDLRLLQARASAAIYSLSFDWARAQGCPSVDRGQTSSFLRDGLHVYKRKWGLAPVREPLAHLTALRLNPACGALRRAFARQRVLVETGAGLEVFAG